MDVSFCPRPSPHLCPSVSGSGADTFPGLIQNCSSTAFYPNIGATLDKITGQTIAGLAPWVEAMGRLKLVSTCNCLACGDELPALFGKMLPRVRVIKRARTLKKPEVEI